MRKTPGLASTRNRCGLHLWEPLLAKLRRMKVKHLATMPAMTRTLGLGLTLSALGLMAACGQADASRVSSAVAVPTATGAVRA